MIRIYLEFQYYLTVEPSRFEYIYLYAWGFMNREGIGTQVHLQCCTTENRDASLYSLPSPFRTFLYGMIVGFWKPWEGFDPSMYMHYWCYLVHFVRVDGFCNCAMLFIENVNRWVAPYVWKIFPAECWRTTRNPLAPCEIQSNAVLFEAWALALLLLFTEWRYEGRLMFSSLNSDWFNEKGGTSKYYSWVERETYEVHACN